MYLITKYCEHQNYDVMMQIELYLRYSK